MVRLSQEPVLHVILWRRHVAFLFQIIIFETDLHKSWGRHLRPRPAWWPQTAPCPGPQTSRSGCRQSILGSCYDRGGHTFVTRKFTLAEQCQLLSNYFTDKRSVNVSWPVIAHCMQICIFFIVFVPCVSSSSPKAHVCTEPGFLVVPCVWGKPLVWAKPVLTLSHRLSAWVCFWFSLFLSSSLSHCCMAQCLLLNKHSETFCANVYH